MSAKPKTQKVVLKSEKRAYEKPVLRQFGTLHMTTQGSGGTKSDGRLGRTRG